MDSRACGRMGVITVTYYLWTTFLAVTVGIILVVSIHPGAAAQKDAYSVGKVVLSSADALLDLIRYGGGAQPEPGAGGRPDKAPAGRGVTALPGPRGKRERRRPRGAGSAPPEPSDGVCSPLAGPSGRSATPRLAAPSRQQSGGRQQEPAGLTPLQGSAVPPSWDKPSPGCSG